MWFDEASLQTGLPGSNDPMWIPDSSVGSQHVVGPVVEEKASMDDLGTAGGSGNGDGKHRGDRGGGRSDGGGGGGSGAGAGASDGRSLGGFFSRIWPGWRRRVAADPDFPFKVLMEETVGLGLAASGMIAARGKEILDELDFAFCDIAVGATLNFILVYLLSPVALVSGISPKTGLSKAISELPANMFATGSFSLPQRLAGFLYKGTLFAVCGFVGSVVGTSMSQGLIQLRRTMAKGHGDEPPRKALPNLAITSAAWAGFMFFSSNPRYQAVAGLERALFSNVPEAVAKVGCASARTINNVVGGAIWVWWARALGIQESKPSESQ
jgi:hypothetical protein